MGDILLDMSEAPLFIFTLEDAPTFDQIQRHLREYQGILTRGRPFVVMFDATKAAMVDAKSRKAYADFLNTNAETMRHLIKAMAFIVTSSLVQGALTAVLWLAPLPYPHKTFTSRDEGRDWLRSKL